MTLPRPSTLQIALGVSVLVHVALLTLRIVDPEGFNRVFQDTPLEVVLVNAHSKDKPLKPQALAQSTLAGGGEAAQGRATSPLPPSALMQAGDSLDDAQRRIQAQEQQQALMLAQVKRMIAALPPADPQAANDAQTRATEDRRRQLTRLLAEIERRVSEENARPRKRYISPATLGKAHALYYDGVRRRIESRGTQYFPQQAGQKLYGELTMVITVNHDGRVLGTEVAETSGNLTLDRHAQTIARSAGPFPRFDSGLRAEADQLVIVARFRFARDDTLETRLSAP